MIVDYYTKMPFVRKMTPSQCSSAKMIAAMKELFTEHGIPEIIRMDNGLQFASHLFAEFTKDWNIDHELSSPQNQEAMAKLNQLSRLLRDYSPVPNTQDRTPTLPCWPTEVHLLMPTCNHLQRCCTNVSSGQQCHRG